MHEVHPQLKTEANTVLLRARELLEAADDAQTVVLRDHLVPLQNGYDLHIAEATANGRLRHQTLFVYSDGDQGLQAFRKPLLTVDLRKLLDGSFAGRRFLGNPSDDALTSGIERDTPMHDFLSIAHMAGDLRGDINIAPERLAHLKAHIAQLMTGSTVHASERLQRKIDGDRRVRITRAELSIGSCLLRRSSHELVNPEIGIGVIEGDQMTQVERTNEVLESFVRPINDADYRKFYAKFGRTVSKSGLTDADFDPYEVDILQEVEALWDWRRLRSEHVTAAQRAVDNLEWQISNSQSSSVQARRG